MAALTVLSACNKPAATTTVTVAGDDPNTVVARYNGTNITLKDVEEKAGKQLRDLEKQKYEIRSQAVEGIVIAALVKAEATKVGQTEDQWVKAQLEAKLPKPSEEEIKKVFEENKARMPPDSTVESMREQIIAFIQRDAQRDAAMSIFADLKKKANYEMLLKEPEEPRVQVAAIGPDRGPKDAKVTIVEFSDFQCPFCSRAEGTVSQVMEKYAGKVRLVFRHFPLSFHENAPKAAEAAMCADAQGKFWEMHKELFANQGALTVPDLKKHAATIGLDQAKFDSCLDSGEKKAAVDADTKAGGEAGVSGTPAFFINGKLLSGAQPAAEFEKIIDAELKKGG